ncbi:hypothetical protein NPIL_264381 [Nephila pilipes]|uniref:Uncharacterized protein n=1 Tax=Nephila pilipes TaxID=299642 RepID=A0A8X6UE12_NEPPI|nr:hypothetical protein NPIL_264381 [Nephila pilipes]
MAAHIDNTNLSKHCHLSSKATLLSVWCEDLGRLLLLRHQKARNGDSATDTQSAEPSKMHQTLPKALPPGPQK